MGKGSKGGGGRRGFGRRAGGRGSDPAAPAPRTFRTPAPAHKKSRARSHLSPRGGGGGGDSGRTNLAVFEREDLGDLAGEDDAGEGYRRGSIRRKGRKGVGIKVKALQFVKTWLLKSLKCGVPCGVGRRGG